MYRANYEHKYYHTIFMKEHTTYNEWSNERRQKETYNKLFNMNSYEILFFCVRRV